MASKISPKFAPTPVSAQSAAVVPPAVLPLADVLHRPVVAQPLWVGKKKDDDEDVEAALPDDGAVVLAQADTAVLQLAQAEAATLGSGAGAGAGTGAAAVGSGASAGAAVASGLPAAGASAGAAGAASASALAASTATAATTTTLTTAASVTGVSSLAGVAGGAVALGGMGGGGGTPDPEPPPPPPANPTPSGDPQTLELGETESVHRLSTAGTALPGGILNKSMVVDLGVTYGPYQGTMYHTQKVDGVVSTQVLAFRDIDNVVGTAVNDQITGHSGANVLDGGAGDDIVYGDGGLDTLRGGEGSDWLLFNPLTRSGGTGAYNGGVEVRLDGTDADLTDVIGVYKNAAATGTAYAEASGFEHVAGSDGGDTIVGTDVANILAGFAGDDVIDGGAGNDDVFGGTSGALGNQLTGGQGNDTFWVGYDINPVARSITLAGATETLSAPNAFAPGADATGVSAVTNTSVIRDWDASNDGLRVSSGGVAVIGGLISGTGANPLAPNWTGTSVVRLDTAGVINLGTIKVAAGAGSDAIYTSSGTERIWVGYHYVADGAGVINGAASPVLSGVASNIIYGWDGVSSTRDYLEVAAGSTAVIGYLQGVFNWDGNDTVDLRTGVNNSGTVVVSSGAGNNVVRGSSGVDHLYGSAGAGNTNQLWGGADADHFYVGVSRRVNNGALTDTEVSRDLVWDWQQGTDVLTVGVNGTAVIAGLMSPVHWNGADTITLASGVTNNGVVVVALGDGNDDFTGSAGKDHVYGGRGINQVTGGAGNDHFWVGLNYNPVADARKELDPNDTAIDVIRDWQDTDDLTVGTRGQAIVAGLYASADWSGADALNVSHATNNGVIKIAAGAGTNTITTSAGVDHVFVGSQFNADVLSTPAGLNAVDVIYGWDDQTTKRDVLAVAAGSQAHIAALLGQANWANRSGWNAETGWAGNDTVDLRLQVSNNGVVHLAAGAGSNTLYGSAGSDHFHTGYVHNSSGVAVASAAGIDTIHGWDAQAWSDLPFAGAWNAGANWNGAAASDNTFDRLTVAVGSTARIGSLSGDEPSNSARWDGVDTVDLRSNVSNLNTTAAHGGGIEVWTGAGNDYVFGSAGRDLIYGGPGLDNLWGGAGNDVFHVGYAPEWALFGANAAEPRIWDWQNGGTWNVGGWYNEGSAGSPGDGLRIAGNSFAVIQGTYGMDPSNPNRWAGNDLVDLRWDVVNYGKVIVESSTGNDVIYGSGLVDGQGGVDYINPGAGSNIVELSNGGADRVYLDSFLTRTQISGFGADDKIYLDLRVLDSFIAQRGIVTPTGYDIANSAARYDSNVDDGRSYDNGWFITSEKTYDATYGGSLQAYNQNPRDPDFNVYGGVGDGTLKFGWASNGAWNNEAHEGAHLNGKIAVIAAGTVSILIGNGLAPIPFVGPVLAIPFWVNGGLMLNDGINNVAPYQNPVYDAGATLNAGAVTVSADRAVASSVGSWDGVRWVGAWDDVRFLDFYNFGSGNFVQSLEVAGQQPGYTEVLPGYQVPGTNLSFSYTFYQAPLLTGVASYMAVYNGTETFIYLVASKDSLIQNNETILLAQVNGEVTADQLVMYNGGTDAEYLRYFNNTVTPPVFPPNPSLSLTELVTVTGGKQMLFKVTYTENSVSVTDYVSKGAYDTLLAASQVANPTVTNLMLQGAYTNDSTVQVTIRFDKPMVATDVLRLFVDGVQVGANITGLTGSSYTTNLSIASDGSRTVTALVSNSDGFEAQGSVGLVRDTEAPNVTDNTTNMVVVTDTEASIIVASNEPGWLRLGATSVQLTEANSNQGTLTLPSSGATQLLSVEDIFGHITELGWVALGTTGNDAVLNSNSRFMYGFAGNDVLQSTYAGAALYGGDGNDTLLGSNSDNKLVGGRLADGLNLGGGNNTVIWSVTASGADVGSDSHSGATDVVVGFRPGYDALVVVATEVNSFDSGQDVNVIAPQPNVHDTLLQLDFTENAQYTDAGDLVVEFTGGPFTAENFLSALRFDLTGTSGSNTLVGGANADRLVGGAGVDTLTGGAGKDTFAFAAGDASVDSPDTITDIGLAHQGNNKDTIDLAGAASVLANSTGTDGTNTSGILSHAVNNGVVTFDDADAFGVAMSVSLAGAVAYLQANLTGESMDGVAAVFQASNGNTYLFQNNETGGDLLINLGAITVAGLTTNPETTTTNFLFIA